MGYVQAELKKNKKRILMQINEIEKFLKKEKKRVKKLYSTKHKKGFETKEVFAKWNINKHSLALFRTGYYFVLTNT